MENERYEMGGRILSCGITLELPIDNKWYSARIEHSEKYGGYYAVFFGKGEKDVERHSMKTFPIGRWGEKSDFDSKEIQSLFD